MVDFIPANRLMIETDSPYLLPRDLPGRSNNRINEPVNLPHIVNSVARHQGKAVEQLANECLTTSQLFFNI